MQRNLTFATSVPASDGVTTLEKMPEVSLGIAETAPPVWRHTLVLKGLPGRTVGP